MEIKVPPLGESISEATVGHWFKSVGDAVTLDAPLVELETDKITLEVNAAASGKLTEIAAPEGANVEVGALLGRIEEAAAAPAEAPPREAPPAPTPPVEAPTLSPAVRKLIEENDLDPKRIKGTGKHGRLLKGDVLAAIAPPAPEMPAPEMPEPGPAAPEFSLEARAKAPEPRLDSQRTRREPMTRLRKRIAERLKEAQNSAAMLTTFNEADLSKVIELRGAFRERFENKHGVKLGFMSFFVKACVTALQEIPVVNAEIDGNDIVYKNYYHIGVAVSAPQGLVVPVVRDADALSFAGIEKAIGLLSVKAREGKLSMEDLSGGTFTITNGGVFGSLMSMPIINPPQSGILGMHKIQERPVAVGGNVELRPMMYLALSYDHRLVDGREAVTFLVRIKECIEDPQRMLLEL